jgi:hypothetical protein
VWARALQGGDIAVALFNDDDGAKKKVTLSASVSALNTITLAAVPAGTSYDVMDIWTGKAMPAVSASGSLTATDVIGHGVAFYRLTPKTVDTSEGKWAGG